MLSEQDTWHKTVMRSQFDLTHGSVLYLEHKSTGAYENVSSRYFTDALHCSS